MSPILNLWFMAVKKKIAPLDFFSGHQLTTDCQSHTMQIVQDSSKKEGWMGVQFPEEGQGPPVEAEFEVEAPAAVESRAIKERLKVILTRDEREAFADELVEFLVERTQLEADLAAVKSQYKAKIDKVTASINEITSVMQAGFQLRDVECTLELDYARGEVRKVRLDTGDIFLRRPMEPAERQRGLDLGIEPQEEQV